MLLLILTVRPLQAAGRAGAEDAENRGEILVIYPEEADRSGQADSLSGIAEALFSLRYTADFAEAGTAAEIVNLYEWVIWCDVTESDRMKPSLLERYDGALMALGRGTHLADRGVRTDPKQEGFLSGMAVYRFDETGESRSSVVMLDPGSMEEAGESDGRVETAAGPLSLVSARGDFRYLPLADYTTPFAKALLIREIARWRWPYDSRMNVYTQYVTLSPVYPFADLRRLKEMVDQLAERRMPFVISVMPIYEHADYPAMKRFCDILRYAQTSGGAVILHAPLLQNRTDPEALAEQLTTATVNYLNQGVFPVALEIPSEWLFEEELSGILGRYRTLFLSEMDAFAGRRPGAYGLKDHIMQGHQQIVPAIRLDETGISHLSTHATAVYLDLSGKETQELEAVIAAAAESPIPLQSLWDMEEAVYLNDGHNLLWDRNTLTVDGVQRFNLYTPYEEEDFDYKRDAYYRFVRNLAGQNNTLIGISVGVLILFVLLGRLSRRQMHRRFLKPKKVKPGKEEEDIVIR
ncbi:MAG: DUF2334 domain-containing protein [Clostridia bacterium]|nr:DUF2334 domain-containing protein [Clostridia bacterium]